MEFFKFQDLPASSGIMQVSQELVTSINLIETNQFLDCVSF